MPYVKLVANAFTPGSTQANTLSTGNFTVPSYIDTVFAYVVFKGNTTSSVKFNTTENFQFVAEQRNSTFDITLRMYQLNRPSPVTAAFVADFGITTYCGLAVVGLVDTVPSYSPLVGYTQITGTVGNATTVSHDVGSVVGDIVLDGLATNPATAPDSVGGGQQAIFIMQINSGGGANAMCLSVSSEVATGTTTTMSWVEPSAVDYAHLLISLKEANQFAAGQGRIIRTP